MAGQKNITVKECKAILVEPAGTMNTGAVGGEMTAADNVRI